MRCPIDREMMRTLIAQGQTLDTCHTCGGVWFDQEELAVVVQGLSQGAERVLTEWTEQFLAGDPLPRTEQVVRCPRDYTEMRGHIFAGDSGAHLEHCTRCNGYWFSGQDVKRLITYVEPNRLQELTALLVRAERKELEELVEKIRVKTEPASRFRGTAVYPLFVLVYGLLAALVEEIAMPKRT